MIRHAILAAALSLSLLGAATSVVAQTPVSSDYSTEPVSFDLYRNKILFSAFVQGRRVNVLLDSGADFTVIDSALAASLGLKSGTPASMTTTNGNIATRIVPAVTFGVPRRFEATMPMLAADLSQASTLIGRRIDVIMGNDILRKYAVAISFTTLQFRLTRSGAQPIGFTRIPVVRSRYAALVELGSNGQTVLAKIDLGSGGDLRVSPEAWARIRPAAARLTDTASGAVNGRITIESKATLPHLWLGDFDEQRAEVRIAPIPANLAGRAEALVGMGVLARYDLMLDMAAGALWLRPRDGLLPRQSEHAGLALMSDGGSLKVWHVGKGSPAEAKGWRTGDRICKVEGAPVDGRGPDDINWTYGPEGRTVTIGLCTGEVRQLTLRSYY